MNILAYVRREKAHQLGYPASQITHGELPRNFIDGHCLTITADNTKRYRQEQARYDKNRY